ncbi:uncharacterized protein ABDE67_004945 [Symphorus nematophorus]
MAERAGTFKKKTLDTLVPVITVQPGEPATFTCVLPDIEISRWRLHWYKQSTAEKLKLIVTVQKSAKPEYAKEFSESRWEVSNKNNFSNLTILRTLQEDEGMYHCEISEWITNTIWSATYLLLKGNAERTSNFTVVQRSTASDPVHPGDLMTLQCSVFSDSDNKKCPGDHSVFWFRPGSDESHPNIIYTDGNRHDECDERSDSQKSCVYRFSKNVAASDTGTYYCAVATCGEILFGNGAKVEIEQTSMIGTFPLMIAVVCLLISVTGNIVLICYQTKRAVCDQCKGGAEYSRARKELILLQLNPTDSPFTLGDTGTS